MNLNAPVVADTATIPVLRPLLPTFEELRPYLQQIDASRHYSNHGPLVVALERRLAAHFGVGQRQLVVLANGTTALSAALLAAGAHPGKRCLVPSWTFVASASAIWAANLEPYFVDVDEETWMLDPDVLRHRHDLADVGAVMTVSAFGAPVDVAAWDAFTAETGIPVIIDAAAGFDSVATVASARPGRAPVMISLHATKCVGAGEGGVVLSSDEGVVHRVRQICNFGVWGSPEGQVLGYNGKLSEYHAAVGLAALDGWPARRSALARLTALYRERLGHVRGVRMLPGYGDGWVSSYGNVRLEDDAAEVIDRLAYVGIETRRWWRGGVHAQRAYRHFGRDPLPATERLGAQVFALPFSHDLAESDVDRIVGALRSAMESPV